MKKFLFKVVTYTIPFALFVAAIATVDPFNYFGVSSFISNEIKLNTSYRLHPHLWKRIEYRRKRCSGIILGDSRSLSLDPDDARGGTGNEYYNFAYGGGSLFDIIDTFWYATEYCELKNVYIGINFGRYNGYEESNNRMIQAASIDDNWFTYAFNKITFTAMYNNLYAKFWKPDRKIGRPQMTKDEFWKSQLEVAPRRMYGSYRHPDKAYTQLRKIADYCRRNAINLVFFIPPCHMDLHDRIVHYGREEDEKRFIEDLKTLATVYDLNYRNEFTEDRSNFSDPFHIVEAHRETIVKEIWGNRGVYSRVYMFSEDDADADR